MTVFTIVKIWNQPGQVKNGQRKYGVYIIILHHVLFINIQQNLATDHKMDGSRECYEK